MITMLIFVACTSFCSCHKDSNNSAIDEDPASLVGTWKITSDEYYEIENGEKSEHYIGEAVNTNITFYADGKGSSSDDGHFSWERSGNSLAMISNEGDSTIFKIKTLTSSTLLIECSETDCYSRISATKVK